VLKLSQPEDLKGEEMRALFDRTFEDPRFMVNVDALLEMLTDEIVKEDAGLHDWVGISRDRGLCGMGVVSTWTYPLSPLPWIVHAHCEIKEARDPLTLAVAKWLHEQGYKKVATHNMSHLNDRAFTGMFSAYASAEIVGSLIVIEIGG
jgi:hypothetical protein